MSGQRGGGRQQQLPPLKISYQRAEVKLNKAEKAWKPGAAEKEEIDEADKMHQQLLKQFRGILNKITPQKFQHLVEQV